MNLAYLPNYHCHSIRAATAPLHSLSLTLPVWWPVTQRTKIEFKLAECPQPLENLQSENITIYEYVLISYLPYFLKKTFWLLHIQSHDQQFRKGETFLWLVLSFPLHFSPKRPQWPWCSLLVKLLSCGLLPTMAAWHPQPDPQCEMLLSFPESIIQNIQENTQFQLSPPGPIPSLVTHSAGKGNLGWSVEFSP